jgi:hypothetical protein
MLSPFHWVLQWAVYLLLQSFSAAIPELAQVKARVEDGERADLANVAVNANRELPTIRPAGCQVVAAGAGDFIVVRELWLMKELFTQLDFARIEAGNGLNWANEFV